MSNSNDRKIVFASILGAILTTGLLALNPSPMIINAGAQMYEDKYDYNDYNNDYYPSNYQYNNYRNNYNEDYGNDYSYHDDDEYSDIQLEFADKYGDNHHKDYSKTPNKRS